MHLLVLATNMAAAFNPPTAFAGPTVAALTAVALWPTTVGAHNWINNPRSRTKGLSKQAPCPTRSGNSISFLAIKGQPFGLEFAQGHPKSYTYFALVNARNENKLDLVTEAALDEYFDSAPEANKSTSPGGFLSDPIFDKIAIEWSGQGPLPLAEESEMYEKRLKPGDRDYFHRPAEWRCSRAKNFNTGEKCNETGVEVAQYKYVPSGLEYDVRAAYHSKKRPWLLAAAKYQHNKKRPQEYDLAQMMFPDTAEPGQYVLMYKWRGYYDCFDVLLVDDVNDGDAMPKLVAKDAWTKTDHSQYEPSSSYVFNNKKSYFCQVLPPNGDVSKCLETCDAKKNCNAVNVVPYKNVPLVVFDEVNIPTTSKCIKSIQSQGVANSSLVCYGFLEPNMPDVGTPNTITDDPRDAVFYSTSYKREKIYTVDNAKPDPDQQPQESSKMQWRFGDQCLSCPDAQKQASDFDSFVFRWTMQKECYMCE